MSKISVLIVDPGKRPRHVNIENTLQNLQRTVGGYIEVVHIATDLVVICNEEGKLMGLEPNFGLCGDVFCGTCIFAGVDGEEFTDLPIDYVTMKLLFPELWEVG